MAGDSSSAAERLRQERETFDQAKQQDRQYFFIRLAMGWVVVFTLPAIMAICIAIVCLHRHFAGGTVTMATATLLVDGAGTIFSFYRLVLSRDAVRSLAPVTRFDD
jgi:hypothetical protein